MNKGPLRLLLHGYGLALAVALALAVLGVGPVPAALVFWLGGAVATLGLGAIVATRAGAARDGDADGDAVFAEAMRRWEDDRLADSLATREAAGDQTAIRLPAR